MLAVLKSLNDHNFPIIQPVLMILVSKFMVHRAFFDKTYLSLGLLSPLMSLIVFFPALDCCVYEEYIGKPNFGFK